jgi:putative ABC transport system substrate-binding protein
MRRRDFIAILTGSVAAWPLIATAQRRADPVIGFLGPQSPNLEFLGKFHQGLNEWGYFEGRNIAIEYRWAFNQNQQLPALAAELVARRVALIVTTGGLVAAKAAREATTTIPILFFGVGIDPVESGFLASFNRPGGNATGVSQSYKELIPKRLELLMQMAPLARKVAYLQNNDITGLGPSEKMQFETETQIAKDLGLVIHFARSESDLEAAFAAMAQQQIEALLVASDPFFGRHGAMIVALAARYALPAGYSRREFADAGGLMSYGPSLSESWQQVGRYAGRILKGARPEDLPVRLQDKYELVINTTTAEMLGLTCPPLLHALADEVID